MHSGDVLVILDLRQDESLFEAGFAREVFHTDQYFINCRYQIIRISVVFLHNIIIDANLKNMRAAELCYIAGCK